MLPRDWELLNFIEEQGFATFRQIERMFFSNQKSFCSRRLGQLRCSGYLGKRTILEAITGQSKMSKNVKYFPHLLNINLDSRDEIYFINRQYAKAFGRSAKLFKPNMVLHQLILNEVRHFLDEEIPHQIVLNDSKVKISAKKEAGRTREVYPDLSYEHGKVKIAVELERTNKARTRYFSKLLTYRLSNYSHVIYYYVQESQREVILSRAGKEKKFAVAHYKKPDELISNIWGVLPLNLFIHRVLEN